MYKHSYTYKYVVCIWKETGKGQSRKCVNVTMCFLSGFCLYGYCVLACVHVWSARGLGERNKARAPFFFSNEKRGKSWTKKKGSLGKALPTVKIPAKHAMCSGLVWCGGVVG